MNADAPSARQSVAAWLIALYALEGAALLCAVAWYKHGDASLAALLGGRYRLPFLGGMAVALVAAVYLARSSMRAQNIARRQFRLTVAMNVITLMLMFAVGEVMVRAFSAATPTGTEFMGAPLLPRRWEDVRARNLAILARAPNHISYFVADELLGWTVGPGRQSRDGRYASSVEGIRSAQAGVSYARDAPVRRVALVGDSYTFGLEVSFEDSWGHHLERALGPGVQVLNFGVDGYGVDQAYLRYQRDVRPWRPDVVVFGFINHDLHRSMAVYPFVSFPAWEMPFAKPRFTLERGALALRNTPLPAPDTLFAFKSIAELPHIAHDAGYHADEWRWRPWHHAYVLRILFTRYSAPAPEAVNDMVRLNSALLKAFAVASAADGARSLIVYFPSRSDALARNRATKRALLDALAAGGVAYADLTACLQRLGDAALFIPDRPHYSPRGNDAVAECLAPSVAHLLDTRAN
jgi:lysophospholipase L1-like esterase